MALLAGAALGACGDTLVDHRNTGVRDSQQPTTCGTNLVQCGTECRSQVVGDPGWVCGASCEPCHDAPPANSALTCTPIGEGGHDGVCGFDCDPGYLKTLAPTRGCSAPALVAAGGQFSCATTADTGEVHCWGANDQGQLGPGVAGASRAKSGKVQFPALVGVTALAAGPAHACAAAGGTVYCWGDATGWNGTTSSATPVEVPELAGASIALAAGAKHTCGITPAGALKCAGLGADGGGSPSLGAGVVVLEASAGESFSCALVQDGSGSRAVKCWGVNDHGQSSGTGSATPAIVDPSSPFSIPFPAGAPIGLAVTHVAAGRTHACATTNQPKPVTMAAFCWGDDTSSQVGVNGNGSTASPPTASNINKPMSTSSPTVIDAGGVTTCAVQDDGGLLTMKCWGGDATAAGGGLGIGELIDTPIVNPPGVFSVGGGHACLVEPPGKLACWGHGTQGQLGNDGAADSTSPLFVLDR